MNECLHDDYAFTNYSQGKIFSKSEVIKWAMSGDINREMFVFYSKMTKSVLSMHLSLSMMVINKQF